MSFEEIVRLVVSAVVTALVVTLGGGLAANWLTRRAQEKRQDFEVRTSLLERTSHVAQSMYINCQHTSRILRELSPEEDVKRREALEDLDSAYLHFSPESAALDTILHARFSDHPGPERLLSETERRHHLETPDVAERWHQIRDLLTIYYFNLKGAFPGDVLTRNSLGYSEGFHSGLNLTAMMMNQSLTLDERLNRMRIAIRRSYEAALADLAESLIHRDS